jgi:hypothetical protein
MSDSNNESGSFKTIVSYVEHSENKKRKKGIVVPIKKDERKNAFFQNKKCVNMKQV